MIVTRTYQLLLKPNRDKFDTARYLIKRFNEYTNLYLGKHFFNGNKDLSTEGLGNLANQAHHKSHSIIKALRAAEKETGNKTNVPYVKNLGVPVKYELSESKAFDYWVKVSNLFTMTKIVYLPAKSHKALNKALKKGWKPTNFGELKLINSSLYLIVFVQKEVQRAFPKEKTIGVDVGINKAISTSYGHKGPNVSLVIKKTKNKLAERNRQKKKFGQVFRKKDKKSHLKQILDKEAKKVVARCLTEEASLVVESRKVIANLKCGKLHGWSRCYFANRCEVLCKENSIFFVEVNPYNTSKTCSHCNGLGERNNEEFICKNLNCNLYEKAVDSDINAAYNISNRGRQVIVDKILPVITIRLSKALKKGVSCENEKIGLDLTRLSEECKLITEAPDKYTFCSYCQTVVPKDFVAEKIDKGCVCRYCAEVGGEKWKH